MHLLDYVQRASSAHPDRPFMVTTRGALAYGPLETSVAALAERLRDHYRPAEPGGAVALVVRDPILLVVAVLACSALEAGALPLYPDTGTIKILEALEDCRVSLLLTDMPQAAGGFAARSVYCLPPLSELASGGVRTLRGSPSPDTVMTYLPTSGSTGRPRYVMTTAGAAALAARLNAEGFGYRDTDVLLSALPVQHSYGIGGVIWPALAAGVTVAHLPTFTPRGFLDLSGRLGATVHFAVPVMYDLLLRAMTDDRPGLGLEKARLFVWGSAPMSATTIQSYYDRFRLYLQPNYGSVEAWGLTYSVEESLETCLETVGYPQPGVSLRTIDPLSGDDLPRGTPGEIVASGPGVGRGYFLNAEATAEVFRSTGVRTGDLGRIDERGRLRLMGRKKRLLKCDGYTVVPEEVELALQDFGEVAEAYVTTRRGMAGNDVLVALVGCPGAAPPDLDRLKAHLRDRLEAYKVPRVFLTVNRLERSDSHKVDLSAAEARIDGLLSARDQTGG